MRSRPALRPSRPLVHSSLALASLAIVACGGDTTKPAVIARVELVTAPSASAADRAAFSTQPVLQVEDDRGVAIARAGVAVTAALVSGSGTLTGTASVQTNSSGQAHFTDLTLAGLVGDKVLAFSVASADLNGGIPTINATVHLVAGPAVMIRSRTGDGQSATVGTALTTNPSVIVQDADMNPVAGVNVTFAVASGGGTITGATQVSDSNGIATAGVWTLGSAAGANTLTASAAGLSGSPVTFSATATAIITNVCGSLTPTTMSIGQVMTSLGGTGICVAGGAAHQEYMLVPFYGAGTNTTSNASFSIQGSGLDAVNATVPAALAPSSSLLPLIGRASASARTPDLNFEKRLRLSERRDLARLIRPTRSRFSPQTLSLSRSLSAIPASVQVGTLVSLNSNPNTACSSPIYKTGRVAAVGQKSIVVSDTTNPAGGFTDAQFESVAATFDTLVDPLDEAAFGAPTDIDGNGRIIIFFTRAVNELTPAGSKSFVGGFFWSRDLFPAQQCAASNVAEMFYMLAPDPTGVVNGNTFSTSFVQQITIGTTAHEYQHLINAARRMYVDTAATSFEEVWLNEGLSHIAEELVFYRESGLSPRQDISSAMVRASSATVSAFNNYESANFGRYRSYLVSPSAYGPYANNDELATRGATWSLLRYLVDHHGSGDGNQWYQLVNSITTGLTNLQNVFGSDILNQIRDWSLSIYTDDVSFGVATQWQQPSWNFRDVYPALSNHLPYALTPQSLQSGSSLAMLLVPSGSAYVRFATQAGANALVQWGSLPAGMQMSLVRIQ